MILGVVCCFVVIISVFSVQFSAEAKQVEQTIGSSLTKTLKYKSGGVSLERTQVSPADDKSQVTFGGVFPQLKKINAYIFEYREGKRILGDELLLWDTKSWKFPEQDVSLYIKYPESTIPNETKYYVTNFQTFISQDVSSSHGFLISGGTGNTSVELKFTATKAKYMSYDVRIFGIQADLIKNHTDVFGSDPDS